jgi:histidine ammonia-lyase
MMTTMIHSLLIQPGQMTLADLRTVWLSPVQASLPAEAYEAMRASSAAIQSIVDQGDAAYGINTGFGKLAKTRIPDDQLEALQRNLPPCGW